MNKIVIWPMTIRVVNSRNDLSIFTNNMKRLYLEQFKVFIVLKVQYGKYGSNIENMGCEEFISSQNLADNWASDLMKQGLLIIHLAVEVIRKKRYQVIIHKRINIGYFMIYFCGRRVTLN